MRRVITVHIKIFKLLCLVEAPRSLLRIAQAEARRISNQYLSNRVTPVKLINLLQEILIQDFFRSIEQFENIRPHFNAMAAVSNTTRMTSETPGMSLQACKACSQQKKRCDRILPMCGSCIKVGFFFWYHSFPSYPSLSCFYACHDLTGSQKYYRTRHSFHSLGKLANATIQ